ncbi:MAG: DUF3455 domain-containing protein [Myxococcales bacterium]
MFRPDIRFLRRQHRVQGVRRVRLDVERANAPLSDRLPAGIDDAPIASAGGGNSNPLANTAKKESMKIWNAAKIQISSRFRLVVCAATAFAVALPQAARADQIIVPSVPFEVAVDAGNVPFLLGHGAGTQNYVCLPSGTGVAFKLFTPEATLVGDDEEQLTTHFFAPNPDEPNNNPALTAIGPIRVAWQYSRDGSTVFGEVKSGNSAVVSLDAIPWLKVTRVGAENGAAGGDVLVKTTFIQRLNTTGGLAPRTGCTSPADIGHLAFVPYTADYFFYKKAPGN